MSLLLSAARWALGDSCAERAFSNKDAIYDGARKEGWVFLLSAVPDELLSYLDSESIRAFAMVHPRLLESARNLVDKNLQYVLRAHYGFCKSPIALEVSAPSPIHGTLTRIRLLSELTEKRFYLVGEDGSIAVFSVDKFLSGFTHKREGGGTVGIPRIAQSPWTVFPTRFESDPRTLPQGLKLNGALYIMGGENPLKSTQARGGLECLDPLCLMEPCKRWALWGSIHRKPTTWKHSYTSFVTALPEKGLHRFSSCEYNGNLYVTGGRYFNDNGGTPQRRNSSKAYIVRTASLNGAIKGNLEPKWYIHGSGGGANFTGNNSDTESEAGSDVDDQVEARLQSELVRMSMKQTKLKGAEEGPGVSPSPPADATPPANRCSSSFSSCRSDSGKPSDDGAYTILPCPDMNIGRYGHASVVYKGRLIVAGGQQNSRLSASVEALDLTALQSYHHKLLSGKPIKRGDVPQWTALPELASPGRFAFALLVIDGDLYAAGGGGGGGGESVVIERLDEEQGSWVVVTTLPSCCDWGAVAACYGSIIYLFGCYDPYDHVDHASPHFNGYDLKKRRWLWEELRPKPSLFSRMIKSPGNFEFSLPFPFQKFSCFVANVCDVTSVSIMNGTCKDTEHLAQYTTY